MDALKETLTKFKKVIIATVVFLAVLLAYNLFFVGGASEDDGASLRSGSQSVVSSEIGREIVTTLNRLKGISIDPEFFEEPIFTRLIDFSVDIEERPVGKRNPFLEEDGDGSATSTEDIVINGDEETEGSTLEEDEPAEFFDNN